MFAKHINDQDNEQDGPGGDDFDPENPLWDDTEGPTQLSVKAFCLDEGLPLEQSNLDPPSVVGPFTVDCGGNPGTLEFGTARKEVGRGRGAGGPGRIRMLPRSCQHQDQALL
jgi:hypothetical protein